MMGYVDERIKTYITNVCKYIKNKKVHKLIEMELLCHFDEIIEENLDRGISKDEAINKAIIKMGSEDVVGEQLNKAHKNNSDWTLLLMTICMTFFGLFTILFLQKNIDGITGNIFTKTIIFMIFSIIISLLLFKVDFRNIKKYSKLIYSFSIGFLMLGEIISPIVNGTRGWIIIGPFSINVASVSALLLIISLAGIFENYNWSSKISILKGITIVIAPCILFITLPSVSMMIVYLISAMLIMNLSGLKVKYLIITIGSLGVIFTMYILNAAYRVQRVLSFVNSRLDSENTGYIYNQIMNLNNSAGILGSENINGLSSLPEAHTDFIFTAIVYSFGWLTGILLLVLVLGFIIRLFFVSKKIKESYGKLVISGLATMLGSEFVLSILANLTLAPAIGIGIPFISYGGSQLLLSFISVAVINNIYKNRNIPYGIEF